MAAVSQALLQHPAAFNTQKHTTGLSAARLNSISVPATKISTKKSSSKQHRIFAQQLDSHSLQPQSRPGDSCACLAATITAPELVEEKVDYNEMAKQLIHASPLEIMDKALSMFGNDIAIAFSGAEDVALIEYARLTGRPFRVFSLDTGRLNPETYQLFAEVEKRYNIHIEYMFPEAVEVQALVRSKGLFSFYEDGHQECCSIRKVKPLKRALRGLRAWITGQRRDQSPGTRATVPIAQVDPSFEGLEGGVGSLVKWNPLANVTGDVVWKFLRTMEVPVNALHHKGYVSIGCEPCTRPVLPGQHEREGRWWWEDSNAKECGLHKSQGFSQQSLSKQQTSQVVPQQQIPSVSGTNQQVLISSPSSLQQQQLPTSEQQTSSCSTLLASSSQQQQRSVQPQQTAQRRLLQRQTGSNVGLQVSSHLGKESMQQ